MEGDFQVSCMPPPNSLEQVGMTRQVRGIGSTRLDWVRRDRRQTGGQLDQWIRRFELLLIAYALFPFCSSPWNDLSLDVEKWKGKLEVPSPLPG